MNMASGIAPAGTAGRTRYPWLFSPGQDLTMLVVPALVTLGAVVAARVMGQDDGGGVRVASQWIAAFLLGNTTHVVLTYLLLGVRRDMLFATSRQAPTVILGALTVFALVTALTRLTYFDPMTRPFFEAVVFVFATHHNLAQVKGFWALYGLRGARQGLPPQSADERSLQSLFVPLSLLLVVIRWTLVGKRPFPESPPMINVNPGDSAILPMWSMWLLLAVWLVYAVALARALFAYDRWSVPKIVYVGTRVFIVALELVAIGWGATMAAAMHGVEYYLITKQMLEPTPEETGKKLRGWLCWVAMAASMAPLFLVGLTRNPFGLAIGRGLPGSFTVWSLAVVNGVVLSHYCADAFIYRFRIPGVRKVAMARLGFGAG
jgi:hypothetical protein